MLRVICSVVPIPLIAYAVFLWIKTPAPRPDDFNKKMMILIIPALIVAHCTFILSMTQMVFEKDQHKLRNGAYVNLALKDTIRLVNDSLFINYNSKDSLKAVSLNYEFSGDEVPSFLRDDQWKRISTSMAHYFKKTPINPDIPGEISLKATVKKQPDLHYRFKLTGDTISMNADRDTTQLIKYIKLSSAPHGQPATTK